MTAIAATAILALAATSTPPTNEASWRWTLAWMLPAAGAQLVLHESAHAVVPALRSDPRLNVSFAPNRQERTFATTTWSADGPALWDGLASASPKLLDVALLLQLAKVKRRVHSPWARGLVSALQITALADFLEGTLLIWRPPSRWNDAWYLVDRVERSGVHLGRGGARAAMTSAALAGVFVFAATW